MESSELAPSRYAQALLTQPKAEYPLPAALPCPYPGHHNRVFQSDQELFDHAKAEHTSALAGKDPRQARKQLTDEAVKLRSDQRSDATAGDGSTPDITGLSLHQAHAQAHAQEPRQSSPTSGKKRRADEEFHARPAKAPSYPDPVEPTSFIIPSDRTKPAPRDPALHTHSPPAGSSPQYQSTAEPSTEPASDTSKPVAAAAAAASAPSQPQRSARRSALRSVPKQQYSLRQPGLVELQRYDPRYPGLLLQPDSRPISQEQLASEVKSIYAGLTMVETKCIHVDRAQAAAAAENADTKLAPHHWQALIAVHRTLLHEHHDFFLASQHPSASSALCRLASKYSMPARMWKHGIHSFLELLRRRLPDSIDYMLAFIYLAYQMMALLYETVPAFEDTWIECLGDLGRYRMAIEDEDIRDRETWAGVARSWYTKAADKNPIVGRLYHHLAILARPNALQQLYYYCRSLTCVKPFPSARESILTLLDPILGRAIATYSHALQIDTNFIKAHAYLFEKKSLQEFDITIHKFMANLDYHIGRVTAKWKEQGVYIAVTNIASWFDYGVDDNVLRQVFLTQLFEKAQTSPPIKTEDVRTASTADQQDPIPPTTAASELTSQVDLLSLQPTFIHAKSITNDTFALVLRRIGDKNVLPNVHIMLCFLNAFAPNKYVSHLLHDSPWAELATFLNTLIKTENHIYNQPQTLDQTHDINTVLAANLFPDEGEEKDELPLPEDYLIRGLIWAQGYFPQKWFKREHDEEERYLELPSTVKGRMERVLRLGYKLSQHNRWLAYDQNSHTFSTVGVQAMEISL